jgi:hypothetical protein
VCQVEPVVFLPAEWLKIPKKLRVIEEMLEIGSAEFEDVNTRRGSFSIAHEGSHNYIFDGGLDKICIIIIRKV